MGYSNINLILEVLNKSVLSLYRHNGKENGNYRDYSGYIRVL